jgi:hypothetical protein
MAHHDEPAASIKDRANRRERHANPPVVRDRLLLIKGHIEVDAHQYGFVLHIDVRDGPFRHERNPVVRHWGLWSVWLDLYVF